MRLRSSAAPASEATGDAPKNSETDNGMEKACAVKQTKNARRKKKKAKVVCELWMTLFLKSVFR